MRSIGQTILPRFARRRISSLARRMVLDPGLGRVDFGHFRRLTPISTDWGFDRGEPIDRFYINRFVEREAACIRGRVLEVGSDEMTRAFGGTRVRHCDVLHVEDAAPPVTIVADLAKGHGIPRDVFDCVIVTQTLQMIYDVKSAIRTIHDILRPGGVVLATVPAITRISREDMDRWGQYWSFTSRSVRTLFCEVFPPDDVQVESYGNVLVAGAFLQGLAAGELGREELLHHDPDFETLVAVRATRGPA